MSQLLSTFTLCVFLFLMFSDGLATQYNFIFHLYKAQRRRCPRLQSSEPCCWWLCYLQHLTGSKVLEVLTFGLPDLVSTNTGHCWRRSSRGHAHWLTHELDPGIEGSSPPSPVLGMYCSAHCSHGEPLSRVLPWESNVLLRTSGQHTWLSPVKTSLSTVRLWWVGAEIFLSWGAKGKPHKLPCSLPPTCHLPIWSVLCLSSVSMPSVHRGHCVNQQAAVTFEFQTNNS